MAVLEVAAEEGLDLTEGSELRSNLISSGGEAECHYAIGRLPGQAEGDSIAVVGIAVTDYGVLVAVPARAWDKKKAKRLLPPDALSRVLAVMVPLAQEEDRSAPSGDPDHKLIMGILKKDYEEHVEYDEDAGTINFGVNEAGFALAPFAPALVAAARDHFAFLTASEGQDAAMVSPPGLGQEEPAVGERLAALEDGLAQLLARLDGQAGIVPPRPKARTKAAASNKARGDLEGISPLVANQALQAGVSQDALMEMMGLMQAPAAPAAGPQAKARPEESSEEEEDANGAAGSAEPSDPVAKAVVNLSKIVGELHKEKKKKKDKDLESILDRAEGGLGKDSSTSSSRSKAAALRQLQGLLHRNPRLIYEAIEQNLQEDWELAATQPGIASSVVSARGWLEHRSRIQAFPSSVRAAWALGGIWDALRANRVAEARARTALSLCMLDQQACDGGQWLLAGELALEPSPPYHAFARHQSPSAWEVPHSRLVDSRWFELFMGKLKDLAEYQEKKNKLNANVYRKPEPGIDPTQGPPKNPAPKAGKGAGKKGQKGAQSEDPPAPAAGS